jgi:predicted secreted hydrolase
MACSASQPTPVAFGTEGWIVVPYHQVNGLMFDRNEDSMIIKPFNAVVMALLWVSWLGYGLSASTTGAQAAQPVYKKALPGYEWQFPRDHGSHPAYKTEWWYYTGHLKSQPQAKGEKPQTYGYQLTFFRTGSALKQAPSTSRWALNDLLIGHFALSDLTQHRFTYEERFGRQAPMQGQAAQGNLAVTLRDWQLTQLPDGSHHLQASSPDNKVSLDLVAQPSKPMLLHGNNGLSQKADCVGCASHYYSYPIMATKGSLTLDGKTQPVEGNSWMDHEFGSNQLTKKQVGWDWFSLQLDNNTQVMLYQMRQAKGVIDPNSSGTVSLPSGKASHLGVKAFSIRPLSAWTSPHTKTRYPASWQVSLPAYKASFTVTPLLNDQELRLRDNTGVNYWEGACTVKGVWLGKPVNGKAYVELTGYNEAFRQKI